MHARSRALSRSCAAIALGYVLVGWGAARADEQTFDSHGVKIHYRVEGQGEPVVLIHGFGVNDQLQWTVPGISKALARDYRVISLDNRGHGHSGKPRDAAAYGAEMAEDVVRLLDHLHIKKAHVVGYSMGAFITLKLSAQHPERLLTATLGGAGWTKKVDGDFLEELASSLEQGKGIAPLLRRLNPKGRPEPTEEQIKAVNAMFANFNDLKALAAVARGMKGLAVNEEQIKNDKVPTLALVGDLDPLKEGVDDLKGRLPDLQTVVIQGADHMNAFSKPEFLKSLEEFLAKHSNSSKER